MALKHLIQQQKRPHVKIFLALVLTRVVGCQYSNLTIIAILLPSILCFTLNTYQFII